MTPSLETCWDYKICCGYMSYIGIAIQPSEMQPISEMLKRKTGELWNR